MNEDKAYRLFSTWEKQLQEQFKKNQGDFYRGGCEGWWAGGRCEDEQLCLKRRTSTIIVAQQNLNLNFFSFAFEDLATFILRNFVFPLMCTTTCTQHQYVILYLLPSWTSCKFDTNCACGAQVYHHQQSWLIEALLITPHSKF